MSLFSRFAPSSKKAEKRRSKGKKRESISASKPRYHHVPTHAAVDALSGAPSSWTRADREKIVEINTLRRRFLVGKTEDGNDSRTSSDVSTNMSSPPRSMAASYSMVTTPRWKKDSARGRREAHMSLTVKPMSSVYSRDGIDSAETSPVPSLTSSIATSDSDSLGELPSMKTFASTGPTKRRARRIHPRPKVFQSQDIFRKLHTNTSRRVGETVQNNESLSVYSDTDRPEEEGTAEMREGPRREVSIFYRRKGGQRPPSFGIVTIMG